ncbi:MAG TPA: M20/M25/M40 family metallo-hydrolase [Edaphobacter sp.]|nr:M20/M25/M40 family metallo-hydrolase [Edaphobacter sp.]
MPEFKLRHPLRIVAFTSMFAVSLLSYGQLSHSFDAALAKTAQVPTTLEREVRADMNFLADDDLHGRGSATRDEHIAALFAASQFQALGLEPGGDNGTFLQKTALPTPLPERLQQRLSKFQERTRKETWNAIGILRGTSNPESVILLTAHLDHLGIGPTVNGDNNYNGADDDASGTTAVLALAHILATGPRPKRTIVFALFGSEEIGGFGNRAFLQRPPVPLSSIVANLEFEMIGRPDPAVPAGTLWLTGFDRSNLGPELAKHGAHLVNDPHPKELFFQRSDNYALAKQGIIAHTVSSFGLHKDYHQPSDELRTIDFNHMANAIASMVTPIRWLADSKWKPEWNPGRKPEQGSPGAVPANPAQPK